jgi:hypothetical protein
MLNSEDQRYGDEMLISVRGDIPDELGAAADVLGCGIVWRYGYEQRVSVLILGNVVAEDLAWGSYHDLVDQLRNIKRDAYDKGMI